MKKLLLLTFTFTIVFILTACGDEDNEGINSNDSNTISNSSNELADTSDESNNGSSQDFTLHDDDDDDDDSDSSAERIILTFNNEEIIVKMYENPTSKEFLTQLPLTLTFEDFGGFEKLSFPPESLTTEAAPSGYKPSRGDFSYFSPWGNVTMFYKDHRFSDGLVKIGEIESSVEKLENISGDFIVTIKKMN